MSCFIVPTFKKLFFSIQLEIILSAISCTTVVCKVTNSCELFKCEKFAVVGLGWCNGFFPEVSLNLFVTGAVTTLLPNLVGLNKAREMLFFSERYGAVELHDLGVAWRVVADDALAGEALDVARKLAALPVLSARAMKRVLYAAAVPDLHRALALETEATVAGFLDPETTRLLKDF